MKRSRHANGRYAKEYRRTSRWEILIVLSVIAAYFVAMGIDALVVKVEALNHVAYAEEIVVEEPEVVLIEVRINWTEERIVEEINKVFWDAPIMVKVAQCESSFDPEAFNATNGSNDRGIFQISEKYHKSSYGDADMFDVQQNLAFARELYDQSGLDPWIWSKPCWSK